MDLSAVASDLFDEIKSRYTNLTLGDDVAQVTTDPQLARFFKFNFNENPISIAIDETELRLIYNRDITDMLDEEQESDWYSFCRTMREFAVTHNLGFKPQDIEKLDLEQGDFEFMSQVNTVKESKMHGTSKTSYDKLDKTKMIVRHSKKVDEDVPGARSRNISAIFIENAQGERFRFPYNYLAGARAMMMHVAKGGNPYDEIGESIVSKVDEIAQLKKFSNYAVRQGLVDETTLPYVEAATDKIKEAKKTLHRLSKETAYEQAVESLNKEESDLQEDDINDLKKMFTKETFDEDIVDAFKFLPINEFKKDDDEKEVDFKALTGTAMRTAPYVNKWINNPENALILKKDDSYDKLQNNLRSQMKDTEQKLAAVMRDIATRFLSADPQDDEVANFASDMETKLAAAGELFNKPDPNMKTLKGVAMQLANRYLQDMKKIQQDPEYKDEVRKSPEDVKAFKNIKGKDIEKGKLTKQYKRKYKDESSQFEAWLDTKVAEMEIALESDEIVKSEYQDPYTV